MKSNNEEHIRGNEHEDRGSTAPTLVSELTDFPFSSLQEIKSAKESRNISFATVYRWNLIGELGTHADITISYLWSWAPALVGLAFIIVSFTAWNFFYLLGVLSTALGLALASPYVRGCTYALLGVCWIAGIYFALRNPVWGWVLGGFYAGYVCGAMVRWRFRRLVERSALESEALFCYLYLNRVLIIKDNRTGMLI